ncbi:MAG TPA: hypothetical protein VF705_12500 [Longimicrobium sp.]|jgi:hypothetical protein
MRVRTYAFTTAVLGILVGAGGCTSGESPTSPLAPSSSSAVKGGGYAGSGSKTDDTSATTTGGGYAGSGSRIDATATRGGGYAGSGSVVEATTTAASGGYAGSGS